MTLPKHILTKFDDALDNLRHDVLTMASLAAKSLDQAARGLCQRDEELCIGAIADDEEIDQLEIEIDKTGVDLLLRFQPRASDLRRVVAAMKLAANIERVADEAVNVARRARKLNRHPELADTSMIEPMCSHAAGMFQDSVEAYVQENAEKARGLKDRDKILDEMNASVSRRLTERMAQDHEQLRGYLNLIFIARHLERIGDHATNIAEDAIYVVLAEDIRHQPFVST